MEYNTQIILSWFQFQKKRVEKEKLKNLLSTITINLLNSSVKGTIFFEIEKNC